MFDFSEQEKIVIGAPLSGEIVALSDIPDAAFSKGILGPGIAIRPSKGCVKAPTDGKIDTMFETGHAVSLLTDTKVELLIHIGMNTVSLNGKHFTTHTKTGETVKKGEKLISFDIDAIVSEGLKTVTPVVICNPDDYAEIRFTTASHVEAGDDFIYLVKKDK